MDTDYTWFVYNGRLLYSMHRTWADAMRSVAKAQRTIEVTLPPYQERYSITDTSKSFPVSVSGDEDGFVGIEYLRNTRWGIEYVRNTRLAVLHPEELEPVALALLAIDKHNKEKK